MDHPVQADTVVASEESTVRVHAALDQLPREQADVIRAAFFADDTHAGIEKSLNIPLGTVKSRLRLALLRLRAILGDLR